MERRLGPLSEAVRERRLHLGLRQADLADLAGCSQRFVHTVEQGKPTLRLDKLLDVLEVLGLGLRLVPGQGELDAGPDEVASQSSDPTEYAQPGPSGP
jgi:y4mF family transcriptional regulator